MNNPHVDDSGVPPAQNPSEDTASDTSMEVGATPGSAIPFRRTIPRRRGKSQDEVERRVKTPGVEDRGVPSADKLSCLLLK